MKRIFGCMTAILLLLPAVLFASDWLPKTNWSLVSFSSENTHQHDERAIYAIDGNSNTHWFSRWSPSPADPLPHHIIVDLGDMYEIDAFSYWPRQSTNVNGQIKKYEFYISLNQDFTKGKFTGEFESGISEKIVQLPYKKLGRYIKFVSTEEINKHPAYCTVAELGIKGVKHEIDVKEIVTDRFKVTFDPSSDQRVTGHNLYYKIDDSEVKIDLKKETIHELMSATLIPNKIYTFTATAYGKKVETDTTLSESDRSLPLYIKIIEEQQVEDLVPPVLRVIMGNP